MVGSRLGVWMNCNCNQEVNCSLQFLWFCIDNSWAKKYISQSSSKLLCMKHKTRFLSENPAWCALKEVTCIESSLGFYCLYLRCLIWESSMSRWASLVERCWKLRPVLEMAHTRASVTESSIHSSFDRLCSSSPPSDELRHMSAMTHKRSFSEIKAMRRWHLQPFKLIEGDTQISIQSKV